MHQIVELGHIAVRGVHGDDLMLAGGGIVITRVVAAQPPSSAAVQLNAKIRLSTRFFCMIFSLDPMVPPLSFGMWRSSARQDRVRNLRKMRRFFTYIFPARYENCSYFIYTKFRFA